jgi:RHS repeat-associated protein
VRGQGGLRDTGEFAGRRSRKGPRAELRRTKTTKANGDQRFQIYTQAGQFVWEGDFVSSQGVASGVNYVNLNGSLIAKLVADWSLPAQRDGDGRPTKLSGVFRNVFADAGATSIVAPADGSRPQRLADVPVTYHLRYVHTDALGSPVVETNAIGEEITGTRTLYEPYGTPLTTPRDGAPSYTGHQYDTGTGLIYAQQRYYDPQLGVFYSPDPMAVDTTSAFNFNRYAYANNSPYKFTDPDGRAGILVAPIVVAAVIVGGGYYVLTHMPARTGSSQSDGLSGLLGSSDTLPFYTPVLNEATEPEGQDGGAAEGGSKTAAGGAATPPPEDENRRREKTDHGQERADQAKYDSSRSVGDSNRVVRDGQRFIDNDTGNTVHVNGNRVVVTNERGDVVTQFRNSRANTISRVESGRWTRVD